MIRRHSRGPTGGLAVVLLAAAALAACTGDAPSEAGPPDGDAPAAGTAVDRETFIETYVDLRYRAVQFPANELPPQERARILEEHGVTEEGLVAFVEAHGRDPSYMESVWSEVESRLDALQEPGRASPDSAG